MDSCCSCAFLVTEVVPRILTGLPKLIPRTSWGQDLHPRAVEDAFLFPAKANMRLFNRLSSQNESGMFKVSVFFVKSRSVGGISEGFVCMKRI